MTLRCLALTSYDDDAGLADLVDAVRRDPKREAPASPHPIEVVSTVTVRSTCRDSAVAPGHSATVRTVPSPDADR